ncbi:MAG: universal stress protein [Burkholderiaceae bacterium]
MYERLLVAVDGSAFAESILPYALGICRAARSQLTLVRVTDAEGQRAEASSYIDALAAELGVEGRCISAEGGVAAAILEEAARKPGTLVVMTSQGRSGVLGVVLGSVAMKVLRGGQSPVLVYRPDKPSGGHRSEPIAIKRVIVPMDGTPLSETVGEPAAKAARWLGAELVVVSVLGSSARPDADTRTGDVLSSSYVRSRAMALGKEHGVEAGWEVLHGDEPEQAIADYVGNDRGTMLAMITRAHAAPISAALLGSVTTGCLRKAGVPILVCLP